MYVRARERPYVSLTKQLYLLLNLIRIVLNKMSLAAILAEEWLFVANLSQTTNNITTDGYESEIFVVVTCHCPLYTQIMVII